MAYEWHDGEVITAEKLNSTGGDVEIVTVTTTDGTNWTADKTWAELLEGARQGKLFMGYFQNKQFGGSWMPLPLCVDANYEYAFAMRHAIGGGTGTGWYIEQTNWMINNSGVTYSVTRYTT